MPRFYQLPAGFKTFGHLFPQVDLNALHYIASELYFRLGRELRIVEVGSFTGTSALALVNYAETLWCVDTWAGGTDPEDRINSLYREHGNNIVLAFADNVLHVADRIRPQRMTSLEAAGLHSPQSLDLVFLDGDHSYEAVKADIAVWQMKIAPGGVLCGHDYDVFEGVTRAANELGPERILGNVWVKEEDGLQS